MMTPVDIKLLEQYIDGTLVDWPDWFKAGRPSSAGRYTFTTARHYTKESPLMPSGLLGPVRILSCEEQDIWAAVR